ncbi:bromodomain-containing protein 4B-like [Engraulis encrasicolus]|uniref:bromodomain-containing protein 4B-like n=1 Tax=Engraulis encrasicolus TaxID=184585 RepID=UPI002FD211DF
MNGKACNLMVSPSNVHHHHHHHHHATALPLGALTGQHVPPSRVQSRPSCSSALRLPAAAGPVGRVQPQPQPQPQTQSPTGGPPPQQQSHGVGGPLLFPSLSLRRQVLTHGKGQDVLGLPPHSTWKQASSFYLPPATSNFQTSKQGSRANALENGGKGYVPHGSRHRQSTNINLQVTNNSMVVQSLGLPTYQHDSCPGSSALSHSLGLVVPYTDTSECL